MEHNSGSKSSWLSRGARLTSSPKSTDTAQDATLSSFALTNTHISSSSLHQLCGWCQKMATRLCKWIDTGKWSRKWPDTDLQRKFCDLTPDACHFCAIISDFHPNFEPSKGGHYSLPDDSFCMNVNKEGWPGTLELSYICSRQECSMWSHSFGYLRASRYDCE